MLIEYLLQLCLNSSLPAVLWNRRCLWRLLFPGN